MRFFLTMLLLSTTAYSLETDNYIVWKKNLEDSAPMINQYLSREIKEVLKETKSNESCLSVTKKVARRFKSYLVHHNPVENWVVANLNENFVFPPTMDYVAQSIYRDPFRFYIPKFGLSPNIQVNGYYFGTDKLSHWASTGMIYYEHYLRHVKELGEEKATLNAIELGILDERSLHGHWASGVFSYADLEANYQGLLFYKSLCDLFEQKPLWSLVRGPRIEDYVSGLWDESYYVSYRLPENWTKIAPVLKSTYCPLKNDSEVLGRFTYYEQTRPESLSWSYLEQKRPHRPQSFDELCAKKRAPALGPI